MIAEHRAPIVEAAPHTVRAYMDRTEMVQPAPTLTDAEALFEMSQVLNTEPVWDDVDCLPKLVELLQRTGRVVNPKREGDYS